MEKVVDRIMEVKRKDLLQEKPAMWKLEWPAGQMADVVMI